MIQSLRHPSVIPDFVPFSKPAAPPNLRRGLGAVFRRVLEGRTRVSVISLLAVIASHWFSSNFSVAMGLVFVLVIHELGHLVALSVLKMPARWPVFIPFVGALILFEKKPRNEIHEAWVGLGGPIAGLLASLVLHLMAVKTGSPKLLMCAAAGYGLNLFNLIPLGESDGGHVAACVGRWLWIPGAIVHAGLLSLHSVFGWHLMFASGLFMLSGMHRAWLWLDGRDTYADKQPLASVSRWIVAGVYLLTVCGCGFGFRETLDQVLLAAR